MTSLVSICPVRNTLVYIYDLEYMTVYPFNAMSSPFSNPANVELATREQESLLYCGASPMKVLPCKIDPVQRSAYLASEKNNHRSPLASKNVNVI